LAALEAMAAGVPVISTNAGGLKEINIDGETGFTSEVGDIKGMSEKARYLLYNNEVLKVFKSRAAAYAKKFDIQYIVPRYEELYERFLVSEKV